jgi:hypothetical protein
MRRRERTHDMITKFVPRMDYVSRPTSKWRGFILFSTKIGNNYIGISPKLKNGLQICCSDAKFEYTSEFMARSSEKSAVNLSQSDIVTSMLC